MAEGADARGGAKILIESAGVFPLHHLSLLDVSGDDARSWLNGQLTNDVRHTKKGDAVYALAVTVKGKILADVWVFDHGEDTFWLAVPTVSVPALLESFDGQIIMEDATVEEAEHLEVLTVTGPAARVVVAAVDGLEGRVFPTDRFRIGGCDVVVDRDDSSTLAYLIAAAEAHGGGAVDRSAFELARLRRGTPRFPVDFDQKNYPQEAGLKARAVSFEKGCYLGQEVVCMLEARGKLSKRLVVLELEGDTAPAPDTNICEDGETTDQVIGRVRSAIVDGDSTLAFAYLSAAFAEAGRKVIIEGRPAEVTAVVS